MAGTVLLFGLTLYTGTYPTGGVEVEVVPERVVFFVHFRGLGIAVGSVDYPDAVNGGGTAICG